MYVDAKLIKDKVWLSSYDENGQRRITTHLPPYVFYYLDSEGRHRSIYNDKLTCVRLNDRKKFYKEVEKYEEWEIFESDIRPETRLLEERFPTDATPPLKVSFVDIEVDKDPQRGFARPDNPYAIINAITVHNRWSDESITMVVPPPNITHEEARELLDQDSKDDEFGSMTEDKGFLVAKDEADLLWSFLTMIEDSDILTGWNSDFYDLPYIIMRLRIVLGGEDIDKIVREDGSPNREFRPSPKSTEILKKLNLFPCLPRMKIVERYGGFEKMFHLFGRIHLDYLQLFNKFTFKELHSYKLDDILQMEVGQTKVAYEGSLDQLYRNDLRTFVAYNRQDVIGLVAVDQKRKMIDLANSMVHMASTTFYNVFGSVAIIEQAILKELHKRGRVCFNNNFDGIDEKIPGAFVVEPAPGIHEWVCSFDINSLYPSVIRALNISPECVVGQFVTDRTDQEIADKIAEGYEPKDAWAPFTGVYEYHDIIDEASTPVTFMVENENEEITAPAKDWKQTLKDEGYSISAAGTVFDTKKEGIVSHCMTKWYDGRVESQQQKKEYSALAEKEEDPDKKAEYELLSAYYDQEQLVKKIFLNSTYGAYLNSAFRFFDIRLGKSVTLTSRAIAKHMSKYACKLLTGNYDFDRRSLICGDTDSSYQTMTNFMEEQGLEKTPENAVATADQIGEEVNASFPDFMTANCLVDRKHGTVIKAAREIVGRRGLFKAGKKKYAIHVINDSGKWVDEMKFVGMDMKRSDTPKYMQDFLEECVTDVVQHEKTYDEIRKKVEVYRKEVFRQREPWERGTPGRVKKLTINLTLMEQYEAQQRQGIVGVKAARKPSPHINAKAAMMTNRLIDYHNEHRWDYIRDGDKVEVLYLRPNPMQIECVARKVEETYIPDWFRELPFNNEKHEQKLVTRKMELSLGEVLNWNFEPISDYRDEVFGEEEDFFA